jgi:hypothetical protein
VSINRIGNNDRPNRLLPGAQHAERELCRNNQRVYAHVKVAVKRVAPIWNWDCPHLYERKSYEHEKEIRAVIERVDELVASNSEATTKTRHIALDLDLLIQDVYVAPTAPPWFRELVQAVLNTYGLKRVVRQSSLDESPIW